MQLIKIILVFVLFSLMTSCYSVRLQVANGTFEPADNEREDTYAGYNVRTIETILPRKITTGENYFNIFDCESGALHTVEYKTTLGGLLLSGITLGRKRKVKIKYVCIMENSM